MRLATLAIIIACVPELAAWPIGGASPTRRAVLVRTLPALSLSIALPRIAGAEEGEAVAPALASAREQLATQSKALADAQKRVDDLLKMEAVPAAATQEQPAALTPPETPKVADLEQVAAVEQLAADEQMVSESGDETGGDVSPPPPVPSAFDFDVPFRGEPRGIQPFLGRATVFVNIKFDDPQTIDQMPGLSALVASYAASGLHVLAFPTDQGWFEPDDSNTLRLKCKSVFDFGQYPSAVVFDKADLLGGNALPLYSWLTAKLSNPWGVNRLVFNYEKFLLDANGQPLRRYPRRFPVQLMEADVRAALEGRELPPPSDRLVQAWEDAKREAVKSEYAFKPGLNYYARGSPAS